MLKEEDLPILIAMAYTENLTESSQFAKVNHKYFCNWYIVIIQFKLIYSRWFLKQGLTTYIKKNSWYFFPDGIHCH